MDAYLLLMVDRRINDRQLTVLQWIADGAKMDEVPTEAYKMSANVLRDRNLIDLTTGRFWEARINDAGRYYLEHRDFPPGHRYHRLDLTPVARRTDEAIDADTGEQSRRKPGRPKKAPPKRPEPQFEIDSPRRLRAKGLSQRDRIDPVEEDAWDDKILVSVKEAAWLLSLPEGTIRKAAVDGDVQRVFIGKGTTNYRIVYETLLAWVDSMPRNPKPMYWGSRW